MKSFSKTFTSLLLASLFATRFVGAQESSSHIDIGTRPASKEATAQMEENRQALLSAEEWTSEKKAFCGTSLDHFPPVYYPSSYHWLVGVSVVGDSVELENGSVWRTSPYDGRKALSWRVSDPLAITQNTSWFSRYTYRIINKNTHSSIEADLFLGPIQNGEYTLYVVALDGNRGEMMLTDNSHWEVCPSDAPIFSNWAINDAIIIGFNSGWESNYEGLLINVTTNNFVRAKQY